MFIYGLSMLPTNINCTSKTLYVPIESPISMKQDDIYEAMLYIHEQGQITVPKLAKVLKCTTRTIYRHMSEELKEEKKLLNNQYEKI